MAKRPSVDTRLLSSSDEDDHSSPLEENQEDEPALLVKPLRSKRMKKPGTASEEEDVSVIKKNKSKSEKERKTTTMTTTVPLPSSSSSSSRKVWTNEEGVFILKALIEFKEKHAHAPSNSVEYDTFLDIVKKSISCDFTRLQLSDKVRKLKMKFFEKRKKTGGEVVTDYEKEILDLGVKIWEDESGEKDKEEVLPDNEVKNGVSDGEFLKETKTSPSVKKKKKKSTATPLENVDVTVTPKTPALDLLAEGDQIGGIVVLTDVVKKFDNEISGGPNLRSFERAMHLMTPARQKAWEDELKKRSIAEIEVYKERKDLENKLVEELHDILKKDAAGCS